MKIPFGIFPPGEYAGLWIQKGWNVNISNMISALVESDGLF